MPWQAAIGQRQKCALGSHGLQSGGLRCRVCNPRKGFRTQLPDDGQRNSGEGHDLHRCPGCDPAHGLGGSLAPARCMRHRLESTSQARPDIAIEIRWLHSPQGRPGQREGWRVGPSSPQRNPTLARAERKQHTDRCGRRANASLSPRCLAHLEREISEEEMAGSQDVGGGFAGSLGRSTPSTADRKRCARNRTRL